MYISIKYILVYIFDIAFILSGSGLNPSAVTISPSYLTWLTCSWTLLQLNLMFCNLARSSTSFKALSCSAVSQCINFWQWKSVLFSCQGKHNMSSTLGSGLSKSVSRPSEARLLCCLLGQVTYTYSGSCQTGIFNNETASARFLPAESEPSNCFRITQWLAI